MEWDFHFHFLNERIMDELLIKASLCRGRDACHCKTLLVLVYSLKMQETAGETHHVQGLKPFYPLCNPLILLWNKQIQVEIP